MAHHGHVPGAPAGHRDEAAAGKIATVVLHLGGLAGPTADAEEAGPALAVTPAREGYPLSPASATVVPRPRPGRYPPSIAGTRWRPEGRAVCAGDDGPRRRGWHVHGFDGPRHAQPVPGSRHLLGAHLVVVTDRPQRAGVHRCRAVRLARRCLAAAAEPAGDLLLVLDLLRRRGRRPACHRCVPRRAAAVASIAQGGPTSSPACCSRSPTR